MENWIFIAAICSSVFSIVALIFGLVALVKVIAIEKSTHSVQFMPIENNEEWANADKKLDDINKALKEESDDILTGIGF